MNLIDKFFSILRNVGPELSILSLRRSRTLQNTSIWQWSYMTLFLRRFAHPLRFNLLHRTLFLPPAVPRLTRWSMIKLLIVTLELFGLSVISVFSLVARCSRIRWIA